MASHVRAGLLDLQINGYRGHDVNAPDVTPETIIELTRSLWSAGTGRYLPTVITGPEERMIAGCRAVARARSLDERVAGSIVGMHVEGPHLSPADGARGAHEPRWLTPPDTALLDRLMDASDGLVRIVTIAPELPGAEEYIAHAVSLGVQVSIGHCAAAPEDVSAAVAAGATLSTHLGNGAPATLPRHPNQIWSQLAADDLTAMFITDGHHLPAEAASSMMRAKSLERSVIVSDAAALAGSEPGEYATPVGGTVVVTDDGALRLPGSPLLAGSGASLLDCVQWATANLPFTPDEVWAMASSRPASLVGIDVSRDALEVDVAGGRMVPRRVVVDDEVVWER